MREPRLEADREAAGADLYRAAGTVEAITGGPDIAAAGPVRFLAATAGACTGEPHTEVECTREAHITAKAIHGRAGTMEEAHTMAEVGTLISTMVAHGSSSESVAGGDGPGGGDRGGGATIRIPTIIPIPTTPDRPL